MTYEDQDITEHFYSGNKKTIEVTVYNADGSLKDLSNCEITYVLMNRKDYGIIYLRKSTHNGVSEIKVTGLGTCEIYLYGADTYNLYGKFRHHVNVVDENGDEETVLTGLVEIHKTSAFRLRRVVQQAYLQGNI